MKSDLFNEIQIILNEIQNKQKLSEDFNIFSILGVETLEIRHSKFIAELLNPKGSHGCQDIFLRQFLLSTSIVKKIEDIEKFCQNAIIETEQFHIIENKQSYIDIVVESSDTVILIENKIYAPDQYEQLHRYYKAKQKESFNKIIIIYLTLDGKEPDKTSLKKLSIDNIELFSYKVHIYNWLYSVLEEVKFDNIKTIISQYLDILEKLTNKNSKEEDMKIADKLLEDNNMQTAFKITQALPRAKAICEMNFYKLLQNQLDTSLKDFGFKIYQEDDWYWNFNEADIKWIINTRNTNTQKVENRFIGLYFYKSLKNGKFLLLKIGEDNEYSLYCECFLSSKHNKLKAQRIRKKDYKETDWIVCDDYTITIAGEEFPNVNFKNNDEIYLKTSDEIKIIVSEITLMLENIILSDSFKELENIFSKN